VPGDYATVGAAVEDLPLNAGHEYFIDVADGYDGSGTDDVHITNVTSGGTDDNGNAQNLVKIYGNAADPTQCTINSLAIDGCLGHGVVKVQGFTITGFAPAVPHAACIGFLGSIVPTVRDCNITADGATEQNPYAVYGYNSRADVRSIDVSGAANLKSGVVSKLNSEIVAQDMTGGGNALTHGYQVEDGDIVVKGTTFGYSSGFKDEIGSGTILSGTGNRNLTDVVVGPYQGFSTNSNQLKMENDTMTAGWRASGSDVELRLDGATHGYLTGGGGHTLAGSPTNLSGTIGDRDGEVRLDDGTNTTNYGTPCTWDSTNSVWCPHDGSVTFS
jgi:hypothetical protein